MKKEELQKRAEALQKELDLLKVQISKHENTDVERDAWFKSICLDIKPVINQDGYIGWVNSKGEWMFYDTKSEYFYIRYSRIWQVLEDKYSMKYGEIQKYIQNELLKVLNWRVKKPKVNYLLV